MEPVEQPRVFSNRYELTHMIARGGMAQVYRARDRLLDRPVALKVLFPELSVDRAFVERFRREAQAAANLSHPNIVPVFDWGEDGGTYFIVMEFIDGQALSAIIRAEAPLKSQRAAEIGAHVASALSYAHRHGVIHRDIKPGNVLLTGDGQVKVTDFGIARAVNTEDSLTQTGAVMGTATYFSPEQAEGQGVDARSDLYSLGVVLFEMVAARPPFLGDSPVAVASKHVRDQPPLLRELNPSVPPAYEAVVMKAMAKSPADRYPDAEELRADLRRFEAGEPVLAGDPTLAGGMAAATTAALGLGEPTTAVDGTAMQPPAPGAGDSGRRRRTRLVVMLVALVVALGVIGYFLGSSLGYWGSGGSFAMPQVVGQPVAAATSVLQRDGLHVLTTSVNSTQPVGIVVSTSPPTGNPVKKGDVVTLSVSRGEPKVTTSPTSTTSPSPSTTSPTTSSTTSSTTSTTSATVAVPSLVLDTVSEAASALSSAGLSLGSQTNEPSNTVGAGLVISSSPAAGPQVNPGSSVSITVSSGPSSLTVPNVVGESQSSATAILQGKGFNVGSQTTNVCTPNEVGDVVAQNPSGGNTASSGSTVTITVCTSTSTPTSTK